MGERRWWGNTWGKKTWTFTGDKEEDRTIYTPRADWGITQTKEVNIAQVPKTLTLKVKQELVRDKKSCFNYEDIHKRTGGQRHQAYETLEEKGQLYTQLELH